MRGGIPRFVRRMYTDTVGSATGCENIPKMPETVRYPDITNRISSLEKTVTEWQRWHEAEDDRRFGEMNAAVNTVNANVDRLLTARSEQIGAARAIAELAEQRSKDQQALNEKRGRRQTLIIGIVATGSALFNIATAHHWLGL